MSTIIGEGMIRVGLAPLKSMSHIVVGVLDLFTEIARHRHPEIEFLETDDLADSDFDYFLSFGFGISPSKIIGRNPDVRFISIWDDLHYHDDLTRESRMRFFETTDILLLTYQKAFLGLGEYGEFHDKSIWFPWWVPDKIIETKSENKQKNRENGILLSGRISDSYPVRQHVRSMVDSIDGLYVHEHPGYGMRKNDSTFDFSQIHSDYIETLRNYKCCFQIGAKQPLDQYQLAKFFEIPASGSVLVATETPFLDELGFVPNENFLQISVKETMDDLQLLVKKILERDDLEKIGSEGANLVREMHTTSRRIDFITDLIIDDFTNRK